MFVADHPLPSRPLLALLRDALRLLAAPRPRRAAPLASRLPDHLLRDLGLTRGDLDRL
jgi:uncharacterized protein YjiS (DUF1127 family)